MTAEPIPPPLHRRLLAYPRHHLAECVFYGAAVLVRCATMAVYRPTVAQWIDGPRFARIVPNEGVFSDFWAPAGYPAFLAVLRTTWNELAFTIGAQHLLGLLTAGLLAATARRCGVPRPWHLLGGAIVAFGGDYLFLEHLLMAETVFLFTLALAVYCGARSLAGGDVRWAIAASCAFALSALVRSNALVALIILPVALFATGGGPIRRRAARALAAAVPGVAVVGLYTIVATSIGPYAGLTDMSGWHLYSRVAAFADCSALDVVDTQPDLAQLCLAAPPGERPGPYFYEWSPDSPARRLWGLDPGRNDLLRTFATEVILDRPGEYLKAVGTDLVRTFAPDFRSRAGHGQTLDVFSFGYRDLAVEDVLEGNYAFEYSGTEVVVERGAGLLVAYQEATRLPGALLLISILAAAAACIVGRGASRRQTSFIFLVGLAIWLGPILLFTWDHRYVVPAAALLVLAGVVGTNTVVTRRADVSAVRPPQQGPRYRDRPSSHSVETT